MLINEGCFDAANITELTNWKKTMHIKILH